MQISFAGLFMSMSERRRLSDSFTIPPLFQRRFAFSRTQEKTPTPSDYGGRRADVEKFAAEVKQLFLQKDWETLSGMMDYPVRLFGETDANNKEEFLAAMNGHEFPDSSFKAMENEPCDDLFANGQGIMLADGLIWFRDVNYDGITQNGTPSFKIITVNTI